MRLWIFNVGQGALLAKLDISNAFTLFQVRPEDFSLLGFTLKGKYHAHCLKKFSFIATCTKHRFLA
jgi:hypothetical protein